MSEIQKPCSVDGCERDASHAAFGRRGMCHVHYQRQKRHGDPHKVITTPSPAKDWAREHASFNGEECLIWPFHTGPDGYGRISRDNNGSLTTASNYICVLAHGPAPSRLHEAAHRCGRGNQGCVNPRHLYWATSKENHADKIIHGTTNRGEQQGSSRLTEDDVRRIRELKGKRKVGDIAREYGIHQSHVSHIHSGRAWAWLD